LDSAVGEPAVGDGVQQQPPLDEAFRNELFLRRNGSCQRYRRSLCGSGNGHYNRE